MFYFSCSIEDKQDLVSPLINALHFTLEAQAADADRVADPLDNAAAIPSLPQNRKSLCSGGHGDDITIFTFQMISRHIRMSDTGAQTIIVNH